MKAPARHLDNARLLVALCCFAAGTALAQPLGPAQADAVRQACRADYLKHCFGIPPGGGAALACLKQNAASASPGCQEALGAASGAPSPLATSRAAPPQADAAPPTPLEATWPHTVSADGGTAVIYQPQIVSWPGQATLNTRIAASITPTSAAAPVLGTIDVAFASATDLGTRLVTLTDPKLTATRFPTLDTGQAVRFENGIRAALDRLGPKQVLLDTVLLSLRQQTDAPPAVPVKNDPPAIYYSDRPASLVVFNGEPVLAPVAATSLSSAVNTNWDVFFNADDRTWYLLNNGGWLAAPDYRGPWAPPRRLPAVFYTLPSDANFAKVRAQVPGRTLAPQEVPTIFVSTAPAEIIVTAGPPQYQRIPGTALRFVANTVADLFQDTSTGTFYYLVSGRWFSAPALTGPWAFATASLPPDFARIPANGPRGSVLASVPGTAQAQVALLHAQIPQQGTLSRSTAQIDVRYGGEPKFEPILGTTLFYAVNTSFDVLRVGDAYYACWQGAWFRAPTPTGPWVLADSVPAVVYTIPPSSPAYPVTYVRVYGATPTTVTFYYTSGYTMTYVSGGVVVYGTGWYYPPYVIPAPVPIYYGYPYTYSGAVYYNSTTGAWARGGTVYGPYGGAVSAGTAYNPATGTWAHGLAVYGPNGGADAWSAYNPSTGSYAHGSASWGTDGGSANASWYNARTGVSGTTNQNANAYSRWGSSQISGPNQTVNTRSETTAQGSAGGFKSTSGAEGAGVHGAGGNNAGVVKGPGGNVYAGADGNVYQHNADGWSKYETGSWVPVTKPTPPGTAGSTTPGAANPNAGGRSSAFGQSEAAASRQPWGSSAYGQQLDQDRFARTEGQQRFGQFTQMQQGFGGGRFAGGGFRGRR
ncbi:MAG TPA: hypothetical protein VLC47_11230 [Burkholderiales bacterium]|nr:hypothetical protein [Burkholderiales bacterium]